MTACTNFHWYLENNILPVNDCLCATLIHLHNIIKIMQLVKTELSVLQTLDI